MAFVFLLHLFYHSGKVLFAINGLKATVDGAVIGFFYSIKILIFAFAGTVLFFAVEPQYLISPLERLARHMGKLGRPVESFALTMFLALRFLPEMSNLGHQTAMAFRTKGIDFKGGLLHKARVTTMLLAPLFVTAYKRTEITAAALSIKGYGYRHSRAVYPPVKFSLGGTIVTLISLVIIVAGWHTR